MKTIVIHPHLITNPAPAKVATTATRKCLKASNIGSNMTELVFDDGTRVLVSYQTRVAALFPDGRIVKSATNYSRTTNRHIAKWSTGLGCPVPVLQSVIDDI
jgi:hypothetical protein